MDSERCSRCKKPVEKLTFTRHIVSYEWKKTCLTCLYYKNSYNHMKRNEIESSEDSSSDGE